jgi:hypothetical protein
MQTDCIDDVHRLDKLKTDWETVYAADPHVTVFTSWAWLRGWIEATPHNWLVLAIRPDNASPYVAFLALFTDAATRGRLHRGKLQMGGDRWADHTGFVCLPEYEEEAIEIFAVFMQKHLQWDEFHIRNVFDPRLDLFLNCFSPRKFGVRQLDSISCPYIPLPDNWSQYLQGLSRRSTRKNLKYYTRQIERLNGFRVTHVQADNLEGQIETLLTLWQSRWGPKPEHVLNVFRATFHRCFESNYLWITILWDGITPISGIGAFADQQKKTFSYWIGGFNDKFSKLSPGTVTVGCSIRYAIENGFQIYDFLRGDEDYKFSFGAIERFNTNAIITRKSLRLALSKLRGVIQQ